MTDRTLFVLLPSSFLETADDPSFYHYEGKPSKPQRNTYRQPNPQKMGGGSIRSSDAYYYYEALYTTYTPYVLLAHGINLVATLICYVVKFRHIPQHYVFVSPVTRLRWTNHALLLLFSSSSSSENRCNLALPDNMMHANATAAMSEAYPDFMPHFLYDFTDKRLIAYDKGAGEFHVIWAMVAFFALSLLFQWVHYHLLLAHPSMPRVLHYIEYAFSSSLMIMVMAVNVGIIEVFAVMGFAAAFFGMNMLGAAAETLGHFVGCIPTSLHNGYVRLIWLIHFAGWVLFLMAMIPIWTQLSVGIRCSDGGTPGFLIAAVALESVCFFLFGFLQVAALWDKLSAARGSSSLETNLLPSTELLFKYDCLHALLSLVAKTFLAWLLMGPAASVITS